MPGRPGGDRRRGRSRPAHPRRAGLARMPGSSRGQPAGRPRPTPSAPLAEQLDDPVADLGLAGSSTAKTITRTRPSGAAALRHRARAGDPVEVLGHVGPLRMEKEMGRALPIAINSTPKLRGPARRQLNNSTEGARQASLLPRGVRRGSRSLAAEVRVLERKKLLEGIVRLELVKERPAEPFEDQPLLKSSTSSDARCVPTVPTLPSLAGSVRKRSSDWRATNGNPVAETRALCSARKAAQSRVAFPNDRSSTFALRRLTTSSIAALYTS